MRSYDQILSLMEREYENLSGAPAAEASDIGIRLRLLAGEIMSLENSLDWLIRQTDPATAQGEYLEALAMEKGLERRGETKAVGRLIFGRSTPLSYDLSIPAGTVCGTEGELFEYVTTEDVRLAAGVRSVAADAEAVIGGRASNCGAGAVTVLITAPEGIETVTNTEAFSGGREEEPDAVLRERLLLAHRLIPGCGNRSFYIDAALKMEGVSSAGAGHDGAGNVTVSVYGEGGPPSSQTIAALRNYFADNAPLNVNVQVAAATPVAAGVSVRIKAKAGYSLEEAQREAEAAIADYFAAMRVGDSFYTAKVCSAVMNCSGVDNCLVNGADVQGEPGNIVVPGSITVWEMSE